MAALTFSGDMRLQDAQAVMRDPQMSRLHDGVRAVSGATILGDGTVALILDVPHVVGAARTLLDLDHLFDPTRIPANSSGLGPGMPETGESL